MRAIHHGSIVAFRERDTGRKRIGHVWQGEDHMVDDENAKCWNISYNHLYSETSDPIEVAHCFSVLGDVEMDERDEEWLKLDCECRNRPEADWLPDTPKTRAWKAIG